MNKVFVKIMEAKEYCSYKKYGVCDGCPYESDPDCTAALATDMVKAQDNGPQAIEMIDKVLRAKSYCRYQIYRICDGCPYENENNCAAEIRADIQALSRGALGDGPL